MVYPGNESLAPEVRKRIEETFRQTLDLAEKGSRQEALLGCDFIMRLDPLFEPARVLSQRLEKSGDTFDVADIKSSFVAAVGEATAEEPPVEAADSVTVDLVEEPAASEPAAKELGVDDLFDEGEPVGEAAPPGPAPTATAPEIPAPAPQPAATAPATPAASAPTPSPETEEKPAPPDAPEPEPEPEIADPTPVTDAPIDLGLQPAAALDSESQGRIEELLDEGQAAFDNKAYQAAIDAWSRIFLIDIDHPEASRRIDLARKLKAELERTVEEALHEGVSHVERGDFDAARASFTRVLELEPGHGTAQDYLARLERDEAPLPSQVEPEPPESEEPAAADVAEAGTRPALEVETEAPPIRRPPPARPRVAKRKKAAPSRGQTFLYIGAAVLFLVLGGGWFLWSNWSSIFPNATETAAPTETRPDPISRAKTLFEQGKQSIAIAQLRRLGPDDPAYAEAQALIFQWESGITEPSSEPDLEELRLTERDGLIGQGMDAYAAGELIQAEELLAQAEGIAPLDGDPAARLEQIRERLEPVRTQLEIFQQGEWEFALRELWRMYEVDPRNPVIVGLMVDCYYNLGVRDLQRGDIESAGEHFQEALRLDPAAPGIERLVRFAQTYSERPEDLLYRIFVKYLPFR